MTSVLGKFIFMNGRSGSGSKTRSIVTDIITLCWKALSDVQDNKGSLMCVEPSGIYRNRLHKETPLWEKNYGRPPLSKVSLKG